MEIPFNKYDNYYRIRDFGKSIFRIPSSLTWRGSFFLASGGARETQSREMASNKTHEAGKQQAMARRRSGYKA